METTRLLIVLGELASDNWLYFENILSKELDQLQAEIVNLKDHLSEITAGKFFTQGNVLISTSYNIETNIIVNATVKILAHALLSFSSSTTKCYLVYAGLCCPSTGDWLLLNDSLTYNHLSSLLHPLSLLLQINGADNKEPWLQGYINLCNDRKALIKIRNASFILGGEFKELAHQICLKILTSLSVSDKHKSVLVSFKNNADILEVNNFKVCVSGSELVNTNNCHIYVALGKAILPKELTNLPCVISTAASKLNKGADYICRLSTLDKLFDFPKGTTTLYNQFNVGTLDMYSFVDEESTIVGLVWVPSSKNVKVVRLMYAQGRDFTKFIDGIKNLLKNKVFQNVAGFCLNERPHKEQETTGFKLPSFPVRHSKTTSSVESTRPKTSLATVAKMPTNNQKLDSSFSSKHPDGKSKEIKDQQTIAVKKNKVEVKSEFKAPNIALHKDKDSVREKNEINKAKSSAASNQSAKTEKPMPVKDKNLKANQMNKVDTTTTGKKTGKTDLNSTGSKLPAKDVHHPNKPTKNGNHKKIKSSEVAPNQVDHTDLMNFSEATDGVSNGVGHVGDNQTSDQGIETAAGSVIRSDTMDTISSHGLISLTSPESGGVMGDRVSEQLVMENDLLKLNEDGDVDHEINGRGNHQIRGEEVPLINDEGDYKVEDHMIKREEDHEVKGGGDHEVKDERDHKVNGEEDHKLNSVEDDKVNGVDDKVTVDEGVSMNCKVDGINGITDNTTEIKPKYIKCSIFGPAETEGGVKAESNEEHQEVGAFINGNEEEIGATNQVIDSNVSNNAAGQMNHQEEGAVGTTCDHLNTSHLKILVDLDNLEIQTNHELNENQAPRSPGYNKFVHDLEVSMLTEAEPVEDFLENIEQPVVDNLVDKPVMPTLDDLNKVHDLSNESIEDEVYEGKNDVVHEAAAKPSAHVKPTQNGTAKSSKISKTDKMPIKKMSKKKKVPTATLR